MICVGILTILGNRDSVVVCVEQTHQQKHHHQPGQRPGSRLAAGMEHLRAVREQVEKGDSQHQPTDTAHKQLGSQMSHPEQRG